MEMGCYYWKRYLFIALVHIYAILYMQRLNLSIALVAMVESSNQTKEVKRENSKSTKEFDWDEAHQGILLSAFYYSYPLPNLPAGVLVDKYGGKIVCGVGILLSSFFSLLTPVAALHSFSFVMVARVCVGLSQGVMYPALLALLRKWSPTGGKNRMVAVATAGVETGAVLAFSLGGTLCATKVLGGWPSVFYIFGGLGIIWFIIWTASVAETPQYDSLPEDADKESQSLKPLIEERKVKNGVPWTQILSSLPLYALCVGFFCQGWVWLFIITDLPLYYKQVLKISVMENGLFSTLPVILAFLTHTTSGFVSDYLQKSCSVKTTRRLTASVGFFPTAAFLIAVSYTREGENVQAIIYMTLCAGVLRFNRVTFLSNIIDLSPTFTGVLMGIATTIAVTAGIGVPLVTGFFTNHNPSRENYRVVFFINAGVCVFGGLFYSAFVSGNIQKWDPASRNEHRDI